MQKHTADFFYEEDEIRELYQVSQLYKIGEANITLLLDEINISNAIKSLMYKICNGEDKSIGISKEQFEYLETRHPMLEVSDSFDDEDDDEDKDEDSYNCNVIYYRKESRNHTILITTAGISESPAILAARQRRSPAMIWKYPEGSSRTVNGCSTP